MNKAAQQPLTKGVHHVGLTVPSVSETAAFFTEALGYQVVGEKQDYPAVFVSDGTTMLTLWQAKTSDPVSFDRHGNVGLHHFAIAVESVTQLETLYPKIADYPGVEIEFSPESLGGLPVKHMMCCIPGGIRMELIATGS